MTHIISLSKHPKQKEYYKTVMNACEGLNGFKYFSYGGAIRGGKSYVTAFIMLTLAEKYAGSRWHVIRQDMPVLEGTTIPTFQKLVGASTNWKWTRSKANYHLKHDNGSQIFFKGENLARDPLLNDFLGLETNGIWLEQAEELSELLWDKALERTGSWYIDNMPPGFIFMTFNPNQNWVKEKIYTPWVKQQLEAPFYFMSALPRDNPFVTGGQWEQWNAMAERYRLQFVEGDWSNFTDMSNLWAFAYNPQKHTAMPELNPEEVVYLSFDFNVNPMCCAVIQHYESVIRVLEIIKLPNAGTEQMCSFIQASKYSRCTFIVTGDATGMSRQASQVDFAHNYTIIGRALGLGMHQFKVPGANPPIEKNKVLVNSLLQNYAVEIHAEKAKALHFDLGNVRTHADNTIIKTNRQDPTQQADALDTFRYWCNVFMEWFLK